MYGQNLQNLLLVKHFFVLGFYRERIKCRFFFMKNLFVFIESILSPTSSLLPLQIFTHFEEEKNVKREVLACRKLQAQFLVSFMLKAMMCVESMHLEFFG